MTRDRAAAIERAISSYRRVFQVNIQNTAAEMMADLIGWHQMYVDENVDLRTLFQLAERRASVVETERESIVRPPEDGVEDVPGYESMPMPPLVTDSHFDAVQWAQQISSQPVYGNREEDGGSPVTEWGSFDPVTSAEFMGLRRVALINENISTDEESEEPHE